MVILVVAAVGVYATGLFTGDKGGSDGEDIDALLMLYGNANGDDTIDGSDLEIVESIIAGTASLDDYPLADANVDGVVDEADIEILQALIDRRSTVAYVYCYDTSNNLTAIEIQYPLENVVVHSTNVTTLICDIGAAGVVAGYFSADEVVHSALVESEAVDLGMTGMSPSTTNWQDFMTLDAEVGGVGAIITESGSDRFANYSGDIEAAQIPLLRFETGTAYDSIAAAITIGFICGEDSEAIALAYADLTFSALNEIEEMISDLSDEDKNVFVAINMRTRIAGTESGYTQKVELAGGLGLGSVSETFASDYAGDSNTNITDSEALSNFDDLLDNIFSFGSYDYSEEGLEELFTHWDDNKSLFEYLGCYEDMVFVNVYMPQACQVAYIASVMYPELVPQEWADELLQSFMEISGATYDFEDVITIYTYQDYLAALAAQS